MLVHLLLHLLDSWSELWLWLCFVLLLWCRWFGLKEVHLACKNVAIFSNGELVTSGRSWNACIMWVQCLEYSQHSTGMLCAGMLNLLVGALVDMLCCRYKWGSYSDTLSNGIQPPTTPATPPSASLNPIYNNSASASMIESLHLVSGPLPTTIDTWQKASVLEQNYFYLLANLWAGHVWLSALAYFMWLTLLNYYTSRGWL